MESDGGLGGGTSAVGGWFDGGTNHDRAGAGVDDELIPAQGDFVGVTADERVGDGGGRGGRRGEGIRRAIGHKLRRHKAKGGGRDVHQLEILGVVTAGPRRGVGKTDKEAVVDEIGSRAVGGPDIGAGIIGKQILDVVIPAAIDTEIVRVRSRYLGVEVKGRGHVGVGPVVVICESEDHAVARAAPGLAEVLHLADRKKIVVVTTSHLFFGEKVDVLALEGRGGEAGLVHPAVESLQPPLITGPVGPNRGHVVVDLEIGNVLPEVGLVFGEGVGRINGAEVGLAGPIGGLVVLSPGFLPVHQHGNAIEGADLGVTVSDGPNVVMGEDLIVAGQIVQQGDVVERIAAIVVSLPGVEGLWILGRARTPVGRVSKEGVAPIKDNVLIQHVEVAGGAIAHAVTTAVTHRAGAVQGFGHKDEVPLAGAGLVDGVLPELGGKTLGEVATKSVDADVGLALGGGGGVAGFFEPVDRVVGEIVPDLPGRGGVAGKFIPLQQEGQLVGIVRVGFVGVLGAFFLHESVVVTKEEFPHIGPVAEVVSVRGNGDLGQSGSGGGREALLGIPAGVEVADLLGSIGGNAEIDRTLSHNGIRSTVVKSAVHHHAHAPLVEAADEGLEFRHGVGLGVAAAEHGCHRPVVPHRIGTAWIEGCTGFRVGVPALDADGMDRLKPEHIHTQVQVVIFVETVGTTVITAGFTGQSRVVDEIQEGAATVKGGVLRLDDKGIHLVHVQGEGLLGGDDDRAVPTQAIVGVVDVVAIVNPGHLVPDLQAVGAAEVHRQGPGVVPVRVRS